MSKTKYITEQVDDADQDEEDLEKELETISQNNNSVEKPENFGNKWSAKLHLGASKLRLRCQIKIKESWYLC